MENEQKILTIQMHPDHLEVILRRYFNLAANDIVRFEIQGWKTPVIIESVPKTNPEVNFHYQEGVRTDGT
jgi:hypothetical protein